MKVGDLVIPTSYSNYRSIYPPKVIVEVLEVFRNGVAVNKYRLEGETEFLREETLELISEA